VHDYIHIGIVLIELLLYKGHLEHILLLIRCRSGADNEEAYPKYAQISKIAFVCYGYFRSYRQIKRTYIGNIIRKVYDELRYR
jgi:hypothetical protein